MLVVLASSSTLFALGHHESSGMLAESAGSADFASGQSMGNIGNDADGVRQLVQILGLANENSLLHDQPNVDLEATDLLLANASIRLSSRILHEITTRSCQSGEHAGMEPAADRTCVLDDESVGLRGFADMLSYAAYRLQRLSTSAPPADATNGQPALGVARIRSIAHLYRMVFALSKVYLDRTQSGVYLDAAHEQLRLARKQMEIASNLCACSSRGYATGLTELAQLDARLAETRGDATRYPLAFPS